MKIEGVKCPICKERLTGSDAGDLSMNLKSHMAEVHDMRGISVPPSGGASSSSTSMGQREMAAPVFRGGAEQGSRVREEEVTQWRSPAAGESAEERQVTTFSGRDPSMESERSRLTREEARQWRYPQTESGERGPMTKGTEHGGGAIHRYTHRKDMMTMSMACPLCGNTVYGSDDDDLTDELRFHFKDAHRNVMQRY